MDRSWRRGRRREGRKRLPVFGEGCLSRRRRFERVEREDSDDLVGILVDEEERVAVLGLGAFDRGEGGLQRGDGVRWAESASRREKTRTSERHVGWGDDIELLRERWEEEEDPMNGDEIRFVGAAKGASARHFFEGVNDSPEQPQRPESLYSFMRTGPPKPPTCPLHPRAERSRNLRPSLNFDCYACDSHTTLLH